MNCEQQVNINWINLSHHIGMNPKQRDFSMIWLKKWIRRCWNNNIIMLPWKKTELSQMKRIQLLKCLFLEWSWDQSELCCAVTHFYDLPGCLTAMFTCLHASSFSVLSRYKWMWCHTAMGVCIRPQLVIISSPPLLFMNVCIQTDFEFWWKVVRVQSDWDGPSDSES